MHRIDVKQNVLLIDSVVVRFKHNIKKYVQLQNILLILLEEIENENVFGYSYDGVMKWRISLSGRVDINSFSPFTGINVINGEIVLNNWSSLNYTINPDTGKILKVCESR
jgi:hypothetical protein